MTSKQRISITFVPAGQQAMHAETGEPFAEVTNGNEEAKN